MKRFMENRPVLYSALEEVKLPATITDVARKAKVSVGTVSRVINGRNDVSPELRSRVERVIAELNYHPSARAQTLVRRSSMVLAFVLSNRDLLHPFHARVLQGAAEYAQEEDYSVLFIPFHYSPSLPAAELRPPPLLRMNGLPECLILGGTNYPNFVANLDAAGRPYVLMVNNYVSAEPRAPFDQVRLDDEGGAFEAVRYLIELGHRDIWYIGDTSLPWYRARHAGYCRAMAEAGLPPAAQTSGLSDEPYLNGRLSMQWILDHRLPVSALFAGTNENAHGAWEELTRRGLRVPAEVSIAGFDDCRGPVRATELTTVRLDAKQVGRELAKMAIAKIRQPQVRFPEVVVPARLAKRASCRPLMGSPAAK